MRSFIVAGWAAAMLLAVEAKAQETAPPPTSEPSTNGSVSATGTGGSGTSVSEPMGTVERSESERRDWVHGISVMVGGGVEGWTGSLASRIRSGPAWDVLVGFRPTSVFGLELAYSGSVNEVKYVNLGLPTPSDGADIVRIQDHAPFSGVVVLHPLQQSLADRGNCARWLPSIQTRVRSRFLKIWAYHLWSPESGMLSAPRSTQRTAV